MRCLPARLAPAIPFQMDDVLRLFSHVNTHAVLNMNRMSTTYEIHDTEGKTGTAPLTRNLMSGPVVRVEIGLRIVRPDRTKVPSIGVCRDVVGKEDQTLGCLEGACRCQPVPASSKIGEPVPWSRSLVLNSFVKRPYKISSHSHDCIMV